MSQVSVNIITNIAYANTILDWSPKVNLIEGLKIIVDQAGLSST